MADISGDGTITGTNESDQITGGNGNDTLIGNGGSDVLNGGGGWNVVAYWSSPNPVGVQLGRGVTSMDGFEASDTLINIHGVFGSAHNDVILGSDWSDLLAGLGGNDTLEGQGGDDAINGYAGDDRINGGGGSDTAYFGGNRADYTVRAIDGGFTVTHNSTFVEWGTEVDEGTDTVTEVEFFKFANGTVSAADVLNPSIIRPDPREEPRNSGDEMLVGGAGNDRIDALEGNDTLIGGAGDDTLIGGAGDDSLDGGAGYDTAAMGNAGFRGVGTGAVSGTLTVTSAAGTDKLANVEVATFADGRLVMDANDPAAQVLRLYEAALDRLPDQGGLNFWIDAVQDGQSLSTLASGFIASGEFRTRFGDMASNGAFVDQLYLNVLDRAGEAGGRQFWTNALNNGTSRADVLVAFSNSDENKAGTADLVQAGIWDRSEAATEVARLYDTVFGRLPDAPGLVSWKTALESGSATLSQVADAFTGSAEFRTQYGSLNNRQFADALYVNSLDRSADQAGLDYWTAQLDAGIGRSAVVLAFSESQEHVALTSANIQSENPGEFGILFA